MDIIGIDPNDRMGPYALDNARRYGIIPKKVSTNRPAAAGQFAYVDSLLTRPPPPLWPAREEVE